MYLEKVTKRSMEPAERQRYKKEVDSEDRW
jgi:hypothetical protein